MLFPTSHVNDDETSAFFLFFTAAIKNIVLENTNFEDRRVYKNNWKDLDVEDLHAYLGLLILWDAEKGRSIFCATMSLEFFKKIPSVIRRVMRDELVINLQQLENFWTNG